MNVGKKTRRSGMRRRHGKGRQRIIERLEDRRLLAVLPVVELHLDVTDLAGNPLPNNQVAVGDDFLLRATVQDVRDMPTGVFAAHMDVTYDNPSPFSVVFSETQQLSFSSKTTGGTYQLGFDGEMTNDIVLETNIGELIFNMRTALEGLSGIGAGNVEIVHNPFLDDQNPDDNNPFRFDIKFINDLFETDVSDITGDPSGLTVSEGSPSLSVEEIAKGVASDSEAFRRSFTPGPDYPFGLRASDGDRDPDDLTVLDPNVFNEVGSYDGFGFFGTEGVRRLLWTVRLNADAVGDVTFAGNAPDEAPVSEVLVFGTEDPVPEGELRFNSTTVSVVGSLSDGIIRGQKVLDADDDGFRELEAEGIDGVTIELVDLATGNVVDTTVTASVDSDGTPGIDPQLERGLYSFTASPGVYEVREAASQGITNTYPGSGLRYIIEVKAGQTIGIMPADRSIHCSLNTVSPPDSWVSSCTAAGTDQYFATAVVELDLLEDGTLDGEVDERILLSGPMRVTRGAPDDSGGTPHFDTEITSLSLIGESSVVGSIRVRAGDGVGNFVSDGPLHSPGEVRQQLTTIGVHEFSPVIAVDLPDQGLSLTSNDSFLLRGLLIEYVPYYQGVQLDEDQQVSLIDGGANEQARILSIRLTPQYGVDFGNDTQTVTNLDFGDAPDSYSTLLPDGASHVIGSGITLGATVDSESDGLPHPTAMGDDISGSDDEGGVRPITTAVAMSATGTTASVLVNASTPAKLDAWIDFNGNNQFDHPSEHLGSGTSINVAAGDNIVPFTIPAGATVGDTFARFRISSQGGLTSGGAATDGEVEDYAYTIVDGDAESDVFVELFAGDVEVAADSTDVTVSSGGIELFRAPGTTISGWEFRGSSNDNTVGLGNLSSAVPVALPLTFDGGAGSDTLRLTGSDQILDLTDVSHSISNIEEIDIIGASPNELVVDGSNTVVATDASNTLVIRHDEDDTVTYSGGGWEVEAPIFADGGQRHLLLNGNARVETINTRPWQNPLITEDVNFSEERTSLDALNIINVLGMFDGTPPFPLDTPTSAQELPEFYVDVDGSDSVSGRDALLVINILSQVTAQSEPEQFVAAPSQPAFVLPDSNSSDTISKEQVDDYIDHLFDSLIQEVDRVVGNFESKYPAAAGLLDEAIDRLSKDPHLSQDPYRSQLSENLASNGVTQTLRHAGIRPLLY